MNHALAVCLSSLLLISGCASKISREVDYSMNRIRAAANFVFPEGVQSTYSAGRELRSGFFSTSKEPKSGSKNSISRSYVKLFIYGPSRPYTLTVSVHEERRRPDGTYDSKQLDDSYAEPFLKSLEQRLTETKPGYDLDQFSPF